MSITNDYPGMVAVPLGMLLRLGSTQDENGSLAAASEIFLEGCQEAH